jgi:hypothetical protein
MSIYSPMIDPAMKAFAKEISVRKAMNTPQAQPKKKLEEKVVEEVETVVEEWSIHSSMIDPTMKAPHTCIARACNTMRGLC